MKKLLFFGPTYTPIYQIFAEASKQVEFVEVLPLSAFENQIKQRISEKIIPILIGTDYNAFTTFFNEVFSSKSCLQVFRSYESRGLVLCDSVKPFWKNFANTYINFFSKIYPLDIPNGIFINEHSTIIQPIIGLPIGHLVDINKIDHQNINVLSFAGTTHIYPDRQKVLQFLIDNGVKVNLLNQITSLETSFDQYSIISYESYLFLLMNSLLTLNFPQTTINSGGIQHIKGRYWESLATGCIILEQENKLCEFLNPKPSIVNYSNPREIIGIIDDYRAKDKAKLIQEKISQIIKFKNHFNARSFFNQFLH